MTKVVHAEFSLATVQDHDTNYVAVAAAGTDDGFVAGSTCSPKCAGIFARTTDGGTQWRVESTGAVLGTTLAFLPRPKVSSSATWHRAPLVGPAASCARATCFSRLTTRGDIGLLSAEICHRSGR